jgi:hypothetical protein
MRELFFNGKAKVLSFIFVLTIPLCSFGKSFYIDLNPQSDQSELWFLPEDAPNDLISSLSLLDSSIHSEYKIVFERDDYFALNLNKHKVYFFNHSWQELTYHNEETLIFEDLFILNSQLLGIVRDNKNVEHLYSFQVYKKKWSLLNSKNPVLSKNSISDIEYSLILSHHFQPYFSVQFRREKNIFIQLENQLNINLRNYDVVQNFNHYLAFSRDSDSAYYIDSKYLKIHLFYSNKYLKEVLNSPYIYLKESSLFYQNQEFNHTSIDLSLLSTGEAFINPNLISESKTNSRSLNLMMILSFVVIIILLLMIFFKSHILSKIGRQKRNQPQAEVKTEYQKILVKLMEQQGRVMDTNNLDVIFGIDQYGYENKRGKRAKLIKEVNTYTQILYGINIINRKKNEQDKRYYDYHISFVRSQ